MPGIPPRHPFVGANFALVGRGKQAQTIWGGRHAFTAADDVYCTRMNLNGRQRGFTMIELLVTMTVGAILMALAVPSFTAFLQSDRAMTQMASLAISLNIARSEAIKSDLPGGVIVCASTDNSTCNASNWATGWIVVSSAGGSPVTVVPPLSAGSTLTEASGLTSITFNSNGGVAAPAIFKLCDARGPAMARDAEVNVIGRIASSQVPGFKVDGVTALTCP